MHANSRESGRRQRWLRQYCYLWALEFARSKIDFCDAKHPGYGSFASSGHSKGGRVGGCSA